MKYQKERHLLKVRVNNDGTINGDDLFDGLFELRKKQCELLYLRLTDFNDIINQLDSEYFQTIKHKVWSLMDDLIEKKEKKEEK